MLTIAWVFHYSICGPKSHVPASPTYTLFNNQDLFDVGNERTTVARLKKWNINLKQSLPHIVLKLTFQKKKVNERRKWMQKH